jgi:hypothetical protein
VFAYDIRNRDKILSEDRFRTGFGHCFAEKSLNLAAFIALHESHDEDRGRYVHNSHSSVLFTIMKIWDDAPKELHRATDIGMWNIGNLLSRETDHWNRPSVQFRKPRITINATLNNRGGFSLAWHPAAEDFSGDRLMTMGGYSGRPSNEIFYFQDFREAMWMVKSEHEKPWDRALRGHLLALFDEMLKEILEIAARHCDVTVDNRLELIRDNKTELPTNWEIVGLRELERRKPGKIGLD